jgi:type VI secretion system protein ImpC
MLGSIQDDLMRRRPPRVKIVYDVETGGAIEKRELPFIVGIFADLSGESAQEMPPVKDRQFIDIDRDSFDVVMMAAKPSVKLAGIENVLGPPPANDAPVPMLAGVLEFSCLEDFGPLKIAQRVPALKSLYDARCFIRDMSVKSEMSEKLGALLDSAVSNTDAGKAVRTELNAAFDRMKPEEWAKVAPAATPAPATTEAPAATGTPTATPMTSGATLAQLLTPDYLLSEERQREHVLRMIGQFTADILWPLTQAAPESATTPESATAPQSAPTPQSASALMALRIASIDKLLTAQLNALMHAPGFQQVEATWRGLHYLVSRTATNATLKLRVMNISKRDLLKDLQKAVEFDQSAVFKLIYEAEYGTYGGDPYSLLVGDYEFGRLPEDIELLHKMAEIAAAAHAPFISSAYARLFDLDTFEKLARPRELGKIFESVELDGWRSFRSSEDSRYVTLTLPRVLLRLPYGPETVAVDGIDFKEDASGSDASKFLWGNSAYMLAQRITNAFYLYGWTAAIRGAEGGGLVEGLPTYKFRTTRGDMAMVCPTQVAITDRREKELNDLGFMAICHCKGSNKAAFFGGQTTNLPKKYFSDLANSNAQISSMLPYMLAASRFAHYIKVIMREKVGSFLTRANIESFLNAWIAQYVLLDDNATQQVKAAYPLRAAHVSVTDVPGKPGAYRATVFLKPHFQLEELTTSIRLVADIPA